MNKKKVLKKIFAVTLSVATFFSLCLGVDFVNADEVFNGSQKREIPIYNVDTTEKLVSISFDCAWGVEYTDQMLSVMEKYGVKSTFFCVQFWVEKYPDYVKKISDMGHEVETHSSTHNYMSKLDKEKIKEELLSSKKAIEDITGKEVTLFRPPYGDYNDKLVLTVKEVGLYTVQWDVDSLDWKGLSKEKITERVLKKVKAGSIILCHNNAPHTAEALSGIFETLLSQGYKFVPIGELIYKDNYYVDSLGTQHKK